MNKKSNNNCCVMNCNNTYKNSTNIKFYNFPNRAYEKKTKDLWIKAVNRVDINGKPWIPTKNSVIRSAHFVGNRKSFDPRRPSYIPTIFPKIYRKKLNDPLQQSARYERAINGESQIIENQSNNTDEVLRCVPLIVDQNNINTSISISTQVAFDVPGDNFIFSCDFHGNSVNTQVSIPKSFHNFTKPTMVEKSCELDFELSTFCFSKISFHGYESIKSENSLKDLTGTTFQIFNFFLTLLPQSNRLIISKENTLLICLMKLKLGFTYSSLSTFFSIHRTTVSRVFSECLLFLSQKCKHLIFWPSKSTIMETLPEV